MNLRQELKGETLYRTAVVNREVINEEDRTVELAFSSETDQVERFFGKEILDHSRKAIRLGRLKNGAPLLFGHDRASHIGVVESARIGQDKVGRATVRFGKSALAQEKFQDVVDGILRNVSVGYFIHDVRQEESEDDVPVFRVVDWEPMEISMVSVPADMTVGVGRSGIHHHQGEENMENQNPKGDGKGSAPKEQQTALEQEDVLRTPAASGPPAGSPAPSEPGPAAPAPASFVNVRQEVEAARQAEVSRIKAISEIGKRSGSAAKGITEQAINEGWSVDQYKGALLDRVQNPKPLPAPNVELGLGRTEIEQYSFCRAILAKAENRPDRAPMEMEISDQLAKKLNRDPLGFLVPMDILKAPTMSRAPLSAGSAGAGAEFVATDLIPSAFIDFLINLMMVNRLGATILTGLEGNVDLPKKAGHSTAGWVNANTDVAESALATGQVPMTPKTLGAWTEISRKLLLQSSLDVENMVRRDLAEAVALELDRAAINGSGSAPEPEGIMNAAGVAVVVAGDPDGAAPTWGDMVNLETNVSVANADIGALAYLTNTKVRGKLKQVEKNPSGPAGQYIWMDSPERGFGSVNGYRAGASNQVPSNLTKGSGTDLSAMIFGNWNDLVIGQWGFLDVLVDPYTQGKKGNLQIIVHQDADIAIRRVESFSIINDIVTT